MPAARTFRVFVSSTFDDFKAERDQLQEVVFPRLRELCAARQTRLHAIDLRWGISDEAAVDQQTVPVCLKEIGRCHEAAPRSIFLVLLGERYGWRPPPPWIPADELDRILALLGPGSEDGQLLNSWYRRDDNADPSHYRLLPRTAERAAFRDPDAWRPVEARIQRLLAGAARSLGLPPHRLLAYEASLTEQEIAAGPLQATLPEDRVFCFFRCFEEAPATGAEVFIEADLEGRQRLAVLKRSLRERFGAQVETYRARWTEEGPRIDLEHLARRAADRLERAVERLLARPDDPSSPPPRDALEREIEVHRGLAVRHLDSFTGRGRDLETLARYLTGPGRRPFGLSGAGGIGKSALLAAAWERASAAHPGALTVLRLLGTTAESSDARSLLASLCRQLARSYGTDEAAVPFAYRDLVPAFGKHLALASAGRPLILILDALDQLAEPEGTGGLAWLPARLPEHAKIVLSTRPGPILDLLRNKGIDVEELAPLPAADGERLLDRWLRGPPARRLTPGQRRVVLDSFAPSGLPLQLRLACAEARRWTSDQAAPELAPLAGDVEGLLRRHLFPRLARPENHGEALVSRTLGYLAASRFGLAEDEVLDLLSRDPEVYAPFLAGAHHLPAGAVPRLPAVLWARLAADLEPYLAERLAAGGTLLSFYHRELAQVAGEQFLAGGQAVALHGRLADYFRSRADPAGDGHWSGGDTRGVAELPYHLTRAGRWREVVETLTDFRYLERKASAGDGELGETAASATGVLALAGDFDRALREMPAAGTAAAPPRDEAPAPIIVTAVDFGAGPTVHCPFCGQRVPLEEAWLRQQTVACPSRGCHGRLRLNPFVVTRERQRWPGKLFARLRRALS